MKDLYRHSIISPITLIIFIISLAGLMGVSFYTLYKYLNQDNESSINYTNTTFSVSVYYQNDKDNYSANNYSISKETYDYLPIGNTVNITSIDKNPDIAVFSYDEENRQNCNNKTIDENEIVNIRLYYNK